MQGKRRGGIVGCAALAILLLAALPRSPEDLPQTASPQPASPDAPRPIEIAVGGGSSEFPHWTYVRSIGFAGNRSWVTFVSHEDENEVQLVDGAVLFNASLADGATATAAVEPGVYVARASKPFAVLTGDMAVGHSMGYYALDAGGFGVSTDLVLPVPDDPQDNGRVVVFSYEDGTAVEVSADGAPLWSGILDAGEHWDRVMEDAVVRVTAASPVSALAYYDQGFYVPSATGGFAGSLFHTFAQDVRGGADLVVTALVADAQVEVRNSDTGAVLWSGVLGAREEHVMSFVEPTFLTITASCTVSVAVLPATVASDYYFGAYVPDTRGAGVGTDFLVHTLDGGYLYPIATEDGTAVELRDPATGGVLQTVSLDAGQSVDLAPVFGRGWVVSDRPILLLSGWQGGDVGLLPASGSFVPPAFGQARDVLLEGRSPLAVLRTAVRGDDVVLTWTAGGPVDHFEIYRATSRVGFDFSSPWADTAADANPETGIVQPAARRWVDVGAADPRAAGFANESYYIVRPVYRVLGPCQELVGVQRGVTSNTAGKFTRQFEGELRASPFGGVYAAAAGTVAEVGAAAARDGVPLVITESPAPGPGALTAEGSFRTLAPWYLGETVGVAQGDMMWSDVDGDGIGGSLKAFAQDGDNVNWQGFAEQGFPYDPADGNVSLAALYRKQGSMAAFIAFGFSAQLVQPDGTVRTLYGDKGPALDGSWKSITKDVTSYFVGAGTYIFRIAFDLRISGGSGLGVWIDGARLVASGGLRDRRADVTLELPPAALELPHQELTLVASSTAEGAVAEASYGGVWHLLGDLTSSPREFRVRLAAAELTSGMSVRVRDAGGLEELADPADLILVDYLALTSFDSRLDTLSVPLEPVGEVTLRDLDALVPRLVGVRWIDAGDWVVRPFGSGDSSPVALGDGFLVEAGQGPATFAGLPAASILHREGAGFGADAASLRAAVAGGSVRLTWADVGADAYWVYRSPSRDGFHTGSAQILAAVAGTEYADGAPLARGYYLVVPLFGGVEGSSTYALGVERLAFEGETVFGLPLEPTFEASVDDLVRLIPRCQGIAFHRGGDAWIGHARGMGQDVYDAAAEIGRAYRVGLVGAEMAWFVGW